MRHLFLISLVSGGLAAVAVAQPAQAAEVRAFSTAAFQAAQRAGKPILIHVHAGWCPVCRRQQPIVQQIAGDPAHRDLVIFTLDYDGQKTEQRPLRVQKQSTLIAFRGHRETGRVVGETNPGRLAALAASTRG